MGENKETIELNGEMYDPLSQAEPQRDSIDGWPIISERLVVKSCMPSMCGYVTKPHPPIVTISKDEICNFFGYQKDTKNSLTVTFSKTTEIYTLSHKKGGCQLQFSTKSALGGALKKIPENDVKNNYLVFIKDDSRFRAYILRIENENGQFPTEEEILMMCGKEEILMRYGKEEFLNDVFINADAYDSLRALLLRKKNIILQGPPGVGKTFSAKRLAYSIIGVKDDKYVSMVQFHQNYSYEDFIQGYRPTSRGFVLRNGPFYQFCKKAEADPDKKYFFIIDEINRGNLSKIFGELLMLIENDKRMDNSRNGEKVKMLYSQEEFSVPANLYIIGMMNTADRSLAMIDYALRRRFSFYELRPAFASEQFENIMDGNKQFVDVIREIKTLNEKIKADPSLGSGCMIGHSYFCNPGENIKLWLQNVVKYEILPLVNEYWYDNEERCKEVINSLYTAAEISE